MKIKYKVLWIENDSDWVDSIEDQIREYIERLGFVYSMTLIDSERANTNYEEYDLILMDLNLSGLPNGAQLIDKIRSLDVFTEVVFYSAQSIKDLRALGIDMELEGVYYSGRTPDNSFVKKVKKVIDSTIRKTQDLANLRGLVMAEVSELDVMMDDILSQFLDNPIYLEKFHKKITADREKTIKKSLLADNCKRDCLLNWRELSISDLISILDASQKARGINLVIVEIAKQYDNDIYTPKETNFYSDYYKDIIEKRNILAHCQSYAGEGKDEVLKTKGGEVSFSNEDFIRIRTDIQDYQKLFLNLKTLLNPQ